jgi:hypothetical protein
MAGNSMTLGQMLRKLKGGSGADDRSSAASSRGLRNERIHDFQGIYKQFEKGKINQD